MPTTRETILSALTDLLSTIPHVAVLRGEVLPERIPPAGLMILRDGKSRRAKCDLVSVDLSLPALNRARGDRAIND